MPNTIISVTKYCESLAYNSFTSDTSVAVLQITRKEDYSEVEFNGTLIAAEETACQNRLRDMDSLNTNELGTGAADSTKFLRGDKAWIQPAHSSLSGIGAGDHHTSFVQADHDALANPHHSSTNDPTVGEKAALVGTSGTPSSTNKYVTNTDTRNTDSRAPSGTASGELGGTYPSPSVAATHSGSAHHAQSHGAADHTGDVIPAANQDFGAFYSDIAQITAPTNPSAGVRRIFMDSADGKLKVRTSGGSSVSLEEQGGGVTFAAPSATIDIGDAADAGVATTALRSDAQFAFTAPTTGYPIDVAATEADGIATTPARSDHQHAHGTGYLPNAHHNQSHDHSAAGDGTTLTPATLNIPNAVTPAQTAEGQAVWDSDGDFLTVGDGIARKSLMNTDTAITATQHGALGAITNAHAHADLASVTADQHHAQSHTHASHTSIGANDHHAQLHASAHAAAAGDDIGGQNLTLTAIVIVDGVSASLEIPNAAGGRTVDVAGEITIDTTPNSGSLNFYDGTAERALRPLISKSITVESPTATEDIILFHTEFAITVQIMRAVVRGSTPSVTWTIRHNTDRSAAGQEVVTGGTVTTNTTTGSDVTTFNDATIPADAWVWLETTAQSGTVNEIGITIHFTVDP